MLARRLGLFHATMLVMGGIVGSGIFVTPATVARSVGTTALILGAWLIGGLVSLTGAFVYAELAARRPDVGGQYAYLRDAYHPALAFLYGWALLFVIQTGGMAASAVTFARYALELWPGAPPALLNDRVMAMLALALLTAVNCLGVRAGAELQSVLMLLKIAAVLALVVAGLALAGRPLAPPHAPLPPPSPSPSPGPFALVAAVGSALVPVLFSYGGWQTAGFVAGEIRDPTRNLPRAMLLGVAGVITLYVLCALVCVRVLGPAALGQTGTPALDVMRRAFGSRGATFLAAAVALSTLGFLSQSILTAPRVYFAMAEDRLFFAAVGKLNPRTHAPIAAIALQGCLAAVIALWGAYEAILSYVVSIDFIFFGLTALALFRFRRRDAATPSYLAPGHPLTTLVFVAVSWGVVLATFVGHPRHSLIGLGLVLLGGPVYLFWRRRSEAAE
jgi:APA family basic amino acid/polyamine antiporter